MQSGNNRREKTPKSKKRKFSSFRKSEAFQYVGLIDLLPWTLETPPVPPSAFFQEHLTRLNPNFDLESYKVRTDLTAQTTTY